MAIFSEIEITFISVVQLNRIHLYIYTYISILKYYINLQPLQEVNQTIRRTNNKIMAAYMSSQECNNPSLFMDIVSV